MWDARESVRLENAARGLALNALPGLVAIAAGRTAAYRVPEKGPTFSRASSTAGTPRSDTLLADSTLESTAAYKEFENSLHGPSRPSYLQELKTGADLDKIGDFSDMTGATMQELMSRVPSDATVRKIVPSEKGSQVGFEYKWYDDNGIRNRLRGHDPDLKAPANSNASEGWVFRLERSGSYYDPVTDQFKHPNSNNIRSSFYDKDAANNTHIPMATPDDWLIELMRWKK